GRCVMFSRMIALRPWTRAPLARPAALVLAVLALAALAAGVIGRALSPGGGGTPPAYRFVPGERLVYRLQSVSEADVDLGGLGAGAGGRQPPGQQRAWGAVRSREGWVQGELTLTVLENEGGRVRLACRLHHPAVVLRTAGQPPTLQEGVAADLQRDVFAELD